MRPTETNRSYPPITRKKNGARTSEPPEPVSPNSPRDSAPSVPLRYLFSSLSTFNCRLSTSSVNPLPLRQIPINTRQRLKPILHHRLLDIPPRHNHRLQQNRRHLNFPIPNRRLRLHLVSTSQLHRLFRRPIRLFRDRLIHRHALLALRDANHRR